MIWRILLTTEDGGVSVFCPSKTCISWLMSGGRWDVVAFPGVQFIPKTVSKPSADWLKDQVERQVATGIPRPIAEKFVNAMNVGGLNERQALELIRDRDAAPHGYAAEIVHVSEVPTDRTYRDAWRRGKNGGPIWIDKHKAREIDETRMWRQHEARA